MLNLYYNVGHEMAHVYQHEPLTSPASIRVLDLLPSLNRQAPICCNIRETQLGSADARYEALSYVWGARQGTQPITCNDRELLVTPNCIAALIQLRRPLKRRTLWIDAICIDQGDDAAATQERNRQVAMMGDLYRLARGVIVWLGPGNEELTPRIFRYLRVLSFFRYLDVMKVPRFIRRTGKFAQPYMVKMSWPDGPGVPRAKGPAFANLIELLGSEWFSRIWTMQEIITSGRCTVMCGASIIEWNQFFVGMRDAGASHHSNANALLLYLRGNIVDEILNPNDTDDDWRSMHDIQLLKAMCKLRCSIPHDKIYGLYAIFRARGLCLPDPDYNRPLLELFEETARAYVQHKRKLDILRITLPPSEASGLPSWIPDWLSGQPAGQLTCSDVTGTVIVCFSDFPSTISSCRGALISDSNASPPPPGKLLVKGKCVGNIKTISAGMYVGAQPVKELSHFFDFVSVCREWCRMIASTASYPTGEDPVLAGLRTITSHREYFPNGRPLDREHLLLWFKTLLDNGVMPGIGNSDETISAGNRLQPDHRDGALENIENARVVQTVQGYVNYKANYAFFTLDSGYFGSAFKTCCKGDDIYLLAGLDMPCVLRRRGNEFRFVAIAYVHGVMRGQLWPEGENELEDLTLV
ncbi:heterokaryon incompatibility protein-domain-containing protein [Xylaria sp. FL1042]|nr:heterokaryon incompatibility protein-domain-containing protein [Xylaria sp. FL1042]